MRRIAAFVLSCAAPIALASGDFAYVASARAPETRGAVVIDTRPLAECRRASLPGARCLPAGEFVGPRGQLPHERDLLWLFGTAGLEGSEKVLVVGTDAAARDSVAGLLYLAGQKAVHVLAAPPEAMTEPGMERGMMRAAVWTAPLRDELWVLGTDILRGHPALADARGAAPPSGARAVVVAPDAPGALARFTQWRAGEGRDVRVYPGAWPAAPHSAATRR